MYYQYESKVHGRLSIHCCHCCTSPWSFTMIKIVVSLSYFVSLDPLCTVIFLRNSYFNSILVDTLDSSSVSFQWATSYCYFASNFEILFLRPKSWPNTSFHMSFSYSIKIFGNNITIISFLDNNTTSFTELRIEQK